MLQWKQGLNLPPSLQHSSYGGPDLT